MSMPIIACLTVGVVNYIDSPKRFDESSNNDLNDIVEKTKGSRITAYYHIAAML